MKIKEKNSSPRDQYTVVLEDIRSHIKVFGESLTAHREHTDRRFDRVEARLLKMEERLIKLELDVELIKSELAIIRHNQITRDEFKFLETRVLHLEKVISRR